VKSFLVNPYAANCGMALSIHRKNRVLRVPDLKLVGSPWIDIAGGWTCSFMPTTYVPQRGVGKKIEHCRGWVSRCSGPPTRTPECAVRPDRPFTPKAERVFRSIAASNAQRASELIPHRTLYRPLGAAPPRSCSSWCGWQEPFSRAGQSDCASNLLMNPGAESAVSLHGK